MPTPLDTGLGIMTGARLCKSKRPTGLHQASSKELMEDSSTELDIDLRSQLHQSPHSFRIRDERRRGFKKLQEARDKRDWKLPSIEARQSQDHEG